MDLQKQKNMTPCKTPPQFLFRFFRWFCDPALRDYIEGDLTELHRSRVATSGKTKADLKLAADIILLLRPGIIRPVKLLHHPYPVTAMFKNYFQTGFRNIVKYKTVSFINIFGLSVAMSVAMLIMLMLDDQKKYDAFNDKKQNIYRILTKMPTSIKPNASSPFPLTAALKAEYPVVAEATHLIPGVGGDAVYENTSAEVRGFFADDSFFKLFSFELELGNKNKALTLPRTMIITREISDKLFFGENPIGKLIAFTDRGLNHLKMEGETSPADWGAYTITGVIESRNYKSHLQFDALISAATMPSLVVEGKIRGFEENWKEYSNCYSYVLLTPMASNNDLTKSLNDLCFRRYNKDGELKGLKLIAQNLTSITPGIFVGNPISFSLPIEVYYFLGFLALIVMISAGVNYTSLSTARALSRAKEIGVRKVTGAGRKDLVFQFLSETVIIALLSMVAALLILMLIKPLFKNLWINRYLNFELSGSLSVYLSFLLFALLVGVTAGIFPAFRLSRLQPISALQRMKGQHSGKLGFQKILSVSQFVVSLFFITTSVLLYNQFKHHLQIDYKFNPQQIVNIKLQGNDFSKVAHELTKSSMVSIVSASDYLPGTSAQRGAGFKMTGSSEEYGYVAMLNTDENFTDNLEIKLVAGKPFSKAPHSDHSVMVNEALARKMGFQNPSDIVGQTMTRSESREPLEVVGVVEDFRFRMPSEKEEIGPLMITNHSSEFRYANVKIGSMDRARIIEELSSAWKRTDAVHPLAYRFYAEQLAETNEAFVDVVSIIGFFAFVAVTIASLGLLGMATYTTERKNKEVGIRKILGAGEAKIMVLLSKEFLRMLFISVCIGAPLTYFANNLWLEHFPNRAGFGLGTMSIGVGILLLIGAVTIGSLTIKASRKNPVEALKVE